MADQDKNVEFFLRSVEEKYGKLKSDLQNLVSAMSAERLDEKKVSAEQALSSVNTLLAMISTTDHPGWLTTLENELTRYVKTHNTTGSANRFLQTLMRHHHEIFSHNWSFQKAQSEVPVKFEEIFKEQYKKSNLEGVFDTLLSKLEEVVGTGEIDSIRAIDALKRLITTIRANARGTYFQTIGTARFIHAVFNNYLRKQLKELPVVGPVLEAIDETIDQMDSEMEAIDAGVRDRLKKDAFGDMPRLPFERHVEKLPNK